MFSLRRVRTGWGILCTFLSGEQVVIDPIAKVGHGSVDGKVPTHESYFKFGIGDAWAISPILLDEVLGLGANDAGLWESLIKHHVMLLGVKRLLGGLVKPTIQALS